MEGSPSFFDRCIMQAKIRLYEKGQGYTLPKPVDLLKFDENAIRERLVDYGYSYDAELNVVEFVDWEVVRTMPLRDAYLLKVVLEKGYDGDETVLVYMLKSPKFTLDDCIFELFKYEGNTEENLLAMLLRNELTRSRTKSFINDLVSSLVEEKEMLQTPKGYYSRLV